jgi:hypothetical protein
VLTRSIVDGYLCFLPFVSSFVVTLVSSLLLIHPPPRAHIRCAAASLSPPSPFHGVVGQKKGQKGKKEKEGKQSKNKKKRIQKKRDRRTVQVGNGNRFVLVKESCATISPGLEAFWATPCMPW